MKRHTFDGLSHISLFVGGFIIVWVVSLTVQNLNDETVFHFLLPGVMMALSLLVWFVIKQRTPSKKQKKWGQLRVSKTHRL
jgi:hypothetical protein